MVAVGATIGISYAYRMKQLRQAEADRLTEREAAYQAKLARIRERERQDEVAREALRQHPNYGNPQFNPMNPDVLIPQYKESVGKRISTAKVQQTQVVGKNSVGIQSGSNVVYNDNSDDMITGMILAQALNRNNDSFAATVSYGTDSTPVIQEVPQETYRAPRSSWDSIGTSSSNDDDSRRSSYTSSYSSSSSDSSYSSSSSDSSSSWD